MDPLPGLGCCRGALVAHLSNAWGVVARSFPFPLFGEGHEMLLSVGSWDFCPLVSRDAHGLFPSSCLDWCFIFSWCETSSWEEDCSRCGNKRKGATVLISSVWRSFYSWACDLQWTANGEQQHQGCGFLCLLVLLSRLISSEDLLVTLPKLLKSVGIECTPD